MSADAEGERAWPAGLTAAEAVAQLAHEVREAHAAGRVHGAIGPDAVRFRRDGAGFRATLAWGAAPSPGAFLPPAPSSGAFLAPEVRLGEPPTPASDVWGLGAVWRARTDGWRPAPAPWADGPAGACAAWLSPEPWSRPSLADALADPHAPAPARRHEPVDAARLAEWWAQGARMRVARALPGLDHADPSWPVWTSRLWRAAGDPRRAVGFALRATTLRRDDGVLWLETAAALAEAGDWPAASMAAERALALGVPGALELAALADIALGAHDLARVRVQGVELAPEARLALVNAALARPDALGDGTAVRLLAEPLLAAFDEVDPDAAAALRASLPPPPQEHLPVADPPPEAFESPWALRRWLHERLDQPSAAAAYVATWSDDPDVHGAAVALGEVALRDGRWLPQLVQAWRRVPPTSDPGFQRVGVDLARAVADQGWPAVDLAVEVDRALGTPESAEVLVAVGLAEGELRALDAIARVPTDAPERLWLALETARRRGDATLAAAHARDAVARFPSATWLAPVVGAALDDVGELPREGGPLAQFACIHAALRHNDLAAAEAAAERAMIAILPGEAAEDLALELAWRRRDFDEVEVRLEQIADPDRSAARRARAARARAEGRHAEALAEIVAITDRRVAAEERWKTLLAGGDLDGADREQAAWNARFGVDPVSCGLGGLAAARRDAAASLALHAHLALASWPASPLGWMLLTFLEPPGPRQLAAAGSASARLSPALGVAWSAIARVAAGEAEAEAPEAARRNNVEARAWDVLRRARAGQISPTAAWTDVLALWCGV